MAYRGSTDPKTVAGVAGVAAEYTNHNGINAPTVTSTGTFTASGTLSATGTANITGTVTMSGTNYLTGANSVYFIGSSGNAIGGNAQSSGTTANIPVQGVQYLVPSGTSTPFYQLGSPSSGAQVTLYAVMPGTSFPVYVYTNMSSALSVPIINGGLNGVHSTSNNMISIQRGTFVNLMGASTYQWLVTGVSTAGSTGATSFSSST